MGLLRIVGPAFEPVTLDEAKDHLRVTASTEDDLIREYIRMARDWAESYTWRAIIDQTYQLTLDTFPTRTILLQKGKTIAINDIAYVDSNGTTQTLNGPTSSPVGTDYQEDLTSEEGGRLQPPKDGSWPSTDSVLNAVTIEFRAGYVLAEDVPSSLKHGVLYRLADLFELRTTGDAKGDWTVISESILDFWTLRT